MNHINHSSDIFGLPGCFDGLFSNVIIEGIYYYHPNQVGSVKFITNDDGTDVVALYHYDPYGSLLTSLSTGTEYSKYKYTAQESDDTTGLYYYNARFYDPAIGRFISADSIVPDSTDTQDFNRYMYSIGNPICYNDPSGYGYTYYDPVTQTTYYVGDDGNTYPSGGSNPGSPGGTTTDPDTGSTGNNNGGTNNPTQPQTQTPAQNPTTGPTYDPYYHGPVDPGKSATGKEISDIMNPGGGNGGNVGSGKKDVISSSEWQKEIEANKKNGAPWCNCFVGLYLSLLKIFMIIASAREQNRYMKNSKDWFDMGLHHNTAAELARQGYTVIVSYAGSDSEPGHVALVLGSPLQTSDTWGEVPVTRGFFDGSVQTLRLSQILTTDHRPYTTYFVYIGGQ